MMIQDGYSKKKNAKFIKCRQMTLDEALNASGHIHFISLQNTLRVAKVNGKIRRWKREPTRFEMPLKYGMYEFCTFTNSDLSRLVVVLE